MNVNISVCYAVQVVGSSWLRLKFNRPRCLLHCIHFCARQFQAFACLGLRWRPSTSWNWCHPILSHITTGLLFMLIVFDTPVAYYGRCASGQAIHVVTFFVLWQNKTEPDVNHSLPDTI